MNLTANFIARGATEPFMEVSDLFLDNPPVFIKPSQRYVDAQSPVVEEFQIVRLATSNLSSIKLSSICFIMRNMEYCSSALLENLFDEIYNDTFSIVSKCSIISNDIRKNIDIINIEGGVRYVSEISEDQSEQEKRRRKDSLRGYGQVGPYRR